MNSNLFTSAFRVALLLLASLPGNKPLIGDESASHLKQRIVQLEAENAALRKIVAQVQSAVKSIPAASRAIDPRDLRIIIVPGEWGASELVDIQKVCRSSAGTIWSQLPDDGFAPILVQRGKKGPITFFKRSAGNEYIVQLDTSDRAWAQCAYQFAHEFCHIICNYRNVENRQLWFEETLCECASLYALRRMSVEWKTNPPYSNWKGYSSSLASYAADRIGKYDDITESMVDFYQRHRAKLEESATNRELNGYMASKLLPLFEKTPAAWQALRYINLGPEKENMTFETYLAGWHDRAPRQHKAFVHKVASEFGIELP